MIRDTDSNNFTINIKLKTGELFENKDIPSSPCGQHETIVSFWIGAVIRVYPLVDIEYYELVPQKD
jgi:hypothetical protein